MPETALATRPALAPARIDGLPLDRPAADACVADFNMHMTGAHQAILRYYNGKGWLAHGYPNLEAAANPVFGRGAAYVYRILECARVEMALAGVDDPAMLNSGSTIVESLDIPTIPVDHAQALKKLPEPEQQRQAYAVAAEIAQREGGRITRKHVEKAVSRIQVDSTAEDRRFVHTSNMSWIALKMDKGELKPDKARVLIEALQACASDQVRAAMRRNSVFDATVVTMLNERRQSEGYREIVTTGHVQCIDHTVPVRVATPADIRQFFDERAQQHRLEGWAKNASQIIGRIEIVDVPDENEDPVFTFRVTGEELLRWLRAHGAGAVDVEFTQLKSD